MMTQSETILFWITVFGYAVAFCVHLFSFVRQKPGGAGRGLALMWIGLACHTATGVVRWIVAEHPPVTDTYELNLTGTWVLVLLFLGFARFRKVDASIGLVVAPMAFLILGHGYMTKSEPIPMSAAYQSPWLWIHVLFAWMAFGSYAIATGAAILLLIRQRAPEWKPIAKSTDASDLDLASYRFVVLGFINHAVMLASGSIWAKNLWGRYWSWDALETWSLIAFLYYAFYLHSRTFLGWKMARAARLAVLGLVVMAISFWGVDYFAPSAPSPHPRSAPSASSELE